MDDIWGCILVGPTQHVGVLRLKPSQPVVLHTVKYQLQTELILRDAGAFLTGPSPHLTAH